MSVQPALAANKIPHMDMLFDQQGGQSVGGPVKNLFDWIDNCDIAVRGKRTQGDAKASLLTRTNPFQNCAVEMIQSNLHTALCAWHASEVLMHAIQACPNDKVVLEKIALIANKLPWYFTHKLLALPCLGRNTRISHI